LLVFFFILICVEHEEQQEDLMLQLTSLPNLFWSDSPRIRLLIIFANKLVMAAVLREDDVYQRQNEIER
jgi:hypothetical protein